MNRRLFLDCDGVLADFDRGAQAILGMSPRAFEQRFNIGRMWAKLAGAPEAKAAGIFMEVRLGQDVERGQPLLHLHAETAAELAYALDYAETAGDIIRVEP